MIDRASMPKIFTIVVTVFFLGFAHQSAIAHGGLSLDKDVCKLQLGKYAMHFTGYQPEATGNKEFCEDIPELGHTVVALDAIDDALREIPIEIRIIRDPEGKSEAEASTVLHIPPRLYSSGSVSFEPKFDQPGKYIGLVTAGDKGEYVSRFPFSVARKKSPYGKYLLMLVVPLLGFALYRFSGRARRLSKKSTMPVEDITQ